MGLTGVSYCCIMGCHKYHVFLSVHPLLKLWLYEVISMLSFAYVVIKWIQTHTNLLITDPDYSLATSFVSSFVNLVH